MDFIPHLLDQLSKSEHREFAFVMFDRFLSQLHAGGGGRLFSLLRQNPDLLVLVGLILGNAPRLADILAQHPQVMDALVDPAFFAATPDAERLSAALSRSLNQANSYEDFLDRLRLFGQEQMFLIGARILSGALSAELAGKAYARLADVIITALHKAVEERFAQTHGRIKGQKTALLAMGKLGGEEMTAASDLDLILVYDFDEQHPESDGARPLYGGQYFARLTQRLISALTARTSYGALYQVDMRLRPSGRSGPVATQIDAFRDYQQNEAWTWEHMALTRARVVSATPGFGAEVEAVIREVLCRPRDRDTIAADALEMRRAIAQEKPENDHWDLKYAAGGLIDVEFVAQYLQLVNAADHPDILDPSDGAGTGEGGARRNARGRGFRNPAPGDAALSRSQPDPAAVPAWKARSRKGRTWVAGAARARGRHAGFRAARCASVRNAEAGAAEFFENSRWAGAGLVWRAPAKSIAISLAIGQVSP